MLDLFDEAIRVTEEISGESSDSVLPEGFARIVRDYNLMSLAGDGTLVDVLAVGRQEAISKPGTRGAAAEPCGPLTAPDRPRKRVRLEEQRPPDSAASPHPRKRARSPHRATQKSSAHHSASNASRAPLEPSEASQRRCISAHGICC